MTDVNWPKTPSEIAELDMPAMDIASVMLLWLSAITADCAADYVADINDDKEVEK